MLKPKTSPSVKFINEKLSLKFNDLSGFDDEIFYEDDNIKITTKTLRNIQKYLDADQQNIEITYGKSILENRNPTIVIKTNNDMDNIITKRFRSNELAAFFIFKKYFPEHFILKDYQIEGIDWLLKDNFRLLADDMGLGKTAQSICAATELFSKLQIKRVLIICPRSLVANWVNELQIWAQPFKSYEVHSSVSQNSLWKKIINFGHFYVINYDQLRKLPQALLDNPLDLVIADEAHKLRKSNSKIHQSIIKLSEVTKRFWALTGTPIEKDSKDLVNIMKVINPKSASSEIAKLDPAMMRAFFRKDFLRRLKKDHLHELKESIEKTVYVNLNDKQFEEYQRVKSMMYKETNDKKILSYFNKLRSICDIFEESSSKLDFIIDLVEKIISVNEKVVIFSFTLEPLHVLNNLLNNKFGKDAALIFEGSLQKEERDQVLLSFKQNLSTSCLLCSGKIASEGLNLTEANNVIFLNEWWNPSTNNQARDRVLRIGQTKVVKIYNIRTKNTVEESLSDILDAKENITLQIVEKMIADEK